MVRAAATGAIDFTRYDPLNGWWWRRLYWITDELDNRCWGELLTAQHRHWVALLGSGLLEKEGRETAWTNAHDAQRKLVNVHFPWLSKEMATPVQTEREQLIADYRAMYGYPGEPRYEAMVKNLVDTLKQSRGKITKPVL